MAPSRARRHDSLPPKRTHPPSGALGGGARGAERRSPHEVSSAPLPAMHRSHPGWRRGDAGRCDRRLTPFTRTGSEESQRTSSEGTRRGGERAVAMGGRSRVMTQTPGDDRPVSSHRSCRAARPANRMRTDP